ncbi:MAG: DUF4236 domain-containing protein [Alphaproteobacteria bacterium]|nr:DUF4236 domain-containing protein [Alphaproteobacteria bacterium]
MGLRFQKRISIFPGFRLNLSKSGVSGSVGPRGADVNIGRHGVTTNASIPGTGLSYRQKMGSRGSKLGILTLVGALAFAAYKNADKITGFFGSGPHGAHVTRTNSASIVTQNVINSAKVATGVRYVDRGGSDLRDLPKTSAKVLKKEPKGQQVQLVAMSGAWAQVRDGQLTGWMRTSVLGEAPAQ